MTRNRFPHKIRSGFVLEAAVPGASLALARVRWKRHERSADPADDEASNSNEKA